MTFEVPVWVRLSAPVPKARSILRLPVPLVRAAGDFDSSVPWSIVIIAIKDRMYLFQDMSAICVKVI